MKKGIYLILYIAVAVLWGCTAGGSNNDDAEQQRVAQPTDTMYTEQKAMEIYDYQPERALQIVDSAEVVGNLSQPRADFLRMRIYSQTQKGEVMDSLLGGNRFEATRAIGERLLQNDAVTADLGMQQNVLEALFYTARQQQNKESGLRWARQLVDVCHRQGAETEALRNEAEIGTILCFMGQKEQGFAKLDSVLAILNEELRTKNEEFDAAKTSPNGTAVANSSFFMLHSSFKFNELDALIIASKRKMDVLANEGRYIETLPIAQRIIDRLDAYELHPEAYHDSTYREPLDSADRADYIQFYRSQAQGRMTAAYAVLGQQQSMEEVYELIERTVRDATAREHIARYQALEHQMLRREAENHSRLMSIIGWGACVALVIILLVVAFIYYQSRRIKQRNHALVRQIDEAIAFKEKYLALREETAIEQQPQATIQSGDPDQLSDTDLFAWLSDIILRERLFLDPLFNRERLCLRFGLSEHQVGAAFSRGSSFGSLPAFVRDLRLNHACQLLREHADMSINKVAQQSGFSNHRTFSTEFKRHFGLSPTEYRQQ